MSLASAVETPAYARFTRRVQAVFIDSIILMLVMVTSLIVATSFASDNVARILGLTFVASWLLYEPLLVSTTGGTIGHHWRNIRVVNDSTGGNIGFAKAVIRTVIKTLLGWLSFLTMTATSRHQAIHDLLTRSTVQISHLAQAERHHFHREREPLPTAGMPSAGRRLVIIAIYLVGAFALLMLAQMALAAWGAVSMRCFDGSRCSPGENAILTAVVIGWLGLSAIVLGLGWRGQLWGARRVLAH